MGNGQVAYPDLYPDPSPVTLVFSEGSAVWLYSSVPNDMFHRGWKPLRGPGKPTHSVYLGEEGYMLGVRLRLGRMPGGYSEVQ